MSKKDQFINLSFVDKSTGETKNAKLTAKEVRKVFGNLILRRAWYNGTSINRSQASLLKIRFNDGTLSIGRQLEVMLECGCTFEFVEKSKFIGNCPNCGFMEFMIDEIPIKDSKSVQILKKCNNCNFVVKSCISDNPEERKDLVSMIEKLDNKKYVMVEKE